MGDNPEYEKIRNLLLKKKYVWVRDWFKPKRIKISKIDWIPNFNNQRHPCVIYEKEYWGYPYKDIYMTKEACVNVIKKDLRSIIKRLKTEVKEFTKVIKSLK